MALRFLDGFDHYAYTDLPKKWLYSSWGDTALNTNFLTTGRFGGQCVFTSQYYLTNLYRNFDNQATWIVGFAFKPPNVTSVYGVIYFTDTIGGNPQCWLGINSGQLLFYRNNGPVLAYSNRTMFSSTWSYVKVKTTINSSTGSVEVRVNGDTWMSASSLNNTNTSNNYANQINFSINYPTAYLDDIYICDGTGSVNNDFLGDLRIATLMPNGSGTNTNWTPSSGSNYACVNETLLNNDTNYVSTSVATTIDTYAIADLSASATSVKGVQTNLAARKEDAGYRQVSSVIRSSGTNYTGTATGLSDGYVFISDVWNTDPATSAAWTPTGVNNMEAGIQLTT